MVRVYVLVVLQGKTPFPIDVKVFRKKEEAEKEKERIEKQYEGNRVYLFERRAYDDV